MGMKIRFGNIVSLLLVVVLLSSCARLQRGPGLPPVLEGSLDHGGRTRTYLYYVPRVADPAKKLPLVLLLHGGLGSGRKMIGLTQEGWNRLADSEGFIAVYPDGIERHWNDGRGIKDHDKVVEGIDDVGFLLALLERLSTQLPVDKSRVYVTGISNGSMMTSRLACEVPGRFAAVALVAGYMPVSQQVSCKPSRPLPVMIIGGTKDPLVPFEGGMVHFRKKLLGETLSFAQTGDFWKKINGCKGQPLKVEIPEKDQFDNCTASVETWAGGKQGSEVVLVTVKDGGHTWPGGDAYAPARYIGHTCRDFDANVLVWEFFKKHSRRATR